MKAITAIFIILHGVTHAILAMVPSSRQSEPQFAMFYPGLDSWLLRKFKLSQSSLKSIALILSVIASIGFISGGLSLLDIIIPLNEWRAITAVSAMISLILLVIFWDRILMIGLLIDVGVILYLLLTR